MWKHETERMKQIKLIETVELFKDFYKGKYIIHNPVKFVYHIKVYEFMNWLIMNFKKAI